MVYNEIFTFIKQYFQILLSTLYTDLENTGLKQNKKSNPVFRIKQKKKLVKAPTE